MQQLSLAVVILCLIVQLKAIDANDTIPDSEELIIALPNGKLRGKDNGFFYSYESIPYAEPPIGELRFESPRLYTQKWEGIRDATQTPVTCMQWDQYTEGDNKLRGVEDCLTVNIYKPKRDTQIEEKFPVLILIHGGAFMFGSVTANGHEHLMHSGRVIVVKMSYRLGPLGFLSTEDNVIAGNFGLKDQLLALQWIKQNIASFGGDAERMMLLGFSSGGAAVHLQMLRPALSNYVKVAASFSGSALNPWVITRKARERAFELAKNLNCTQVETAQNIKDCLKKQPAAAIVAAVRNFLVFEYNPFTTFGPVVESAAVDDAFLTQNPEEILSTGGFAQIPWLTSYAAQDGGYNAAELLQLKPRREELIEVFNERWYDLAPYVFFFKDAMGSVEELDGHSRALKQLYLRDEDFSLQTYPQVQRMYTDVLFKDGIEKAVRLQRQFGKSPVYAYVYDNPADTGIGQSLAGRSDVKFGTVHGDDFFLIFHNSVRSKELRADEQVISEKFIKMLEDFLINGGDPSFGSCPFVDNVGKESLQLMFITRDSCESKNVTHFPTL